MFLSSLRTFGCARMSANGAAHGTVHFAPCTERRGYVCHTYKGQERSWSGSWGLVRRGPNLQLRKMRTRNNSKNSQLQIGVCVCVGGGTGVCFFLGESKSVRSFQYLGQRALSCVCSLDISDPQNLVTEDYQDELMKVGLTCPMGYEPFWDRCLKLVSFNSVRWSFSV